MKVERARHRRRLQKHRPIQNIYLAPSTDDCKLASVTHPFSHGAAISSKYTSFNDRAARPCWTHPQWRTVFHHLGIYRRHHRHKDQELWNPSLHIFLEIVNLNRRKNRNKTIGWNLKTKMPSCAAYILERRGTTWKGGNWERIRLAWVSKFASTSASVPDCFCLKKFKLTFDNKVIWKPNQRFPYLVRGIVLHRHTNWITFYSGKSNPRIQIV